MTGGQIMEVFVDTYPPTVLFSPETMSMPSIYSRLRDCLNANGETLTTHFSQRVILTTSSSLYAEREYREATKQTAQEIITGDRHTERCVASTETPCSNSGYATSYKFTTLKEYKVTHNIFMRIRDKYKTFSGDFDGS